MARCVSCPSRSIRAPSSASVSSKLRGSCHCGNISFELAWPGDAAAGANFTIPARRCGCTFCIKHGGIWTSHPAGALKARLARPAEVSRYEFGTGTAEFLVCARCGAAPLVLSRIAGRDYAVVNVNTFDGIDATRIQVAPASFEGEDVEGRLARRQRNWIGDVSIEEAAP
jgi:hypothetical protein